MFLDRQASMWFKLSERRSAISGEEHYLLRHQVNDGTLDP
jgi:hypothetical protein